LEKLKNHTQTCISEITQIVLRCVKSNMQMINALLTTGGAYFQYLL